MDINENNKHDDDTNCYGCKCLKLPVIKQPIYFVHEEFCKLYDPYAVNDGNDYTESFN